MQLIVEYFTTKATKGFTKEHKVNSIIKELHQYFEFRTFSLCSFPDLSGKIWFSFERLCG